MSTFSNTPVPRLPQAPLEYDEVYFNKLLNALGLYFNGLNGVQQLNASKLNLNLDTLPTEADVATLRSGDVYVDTTASNVLKVKT